MQLHKLENPDVTEAITICRSEKKFANTKDIEASFNSIDALWIPKMFNFACYDATLIMFSRNPNTLITFQATISKDHKFQQERVASLIKHLEAKTTLPADLKVWHIFVLKTFDQLECFKGLGCDHVVLQNQQGAQKRGS